MASRRRKRNAFTKRRGTRVIIYIRVSDTTGREDTLISDQVQMDQCMRLVRSECFDVVEVITELDKSGRESKHRAISKIIDRVAANEVDGVLVWKISRWGRNTIDSMFNIRELQDAGGFILSATENLDDIDTPAGRFSLTVLLAIAQMYSDEIGKTWANIHDYRRGEGKTHNGSPRLGYINVKHIPLHDLKNYNVLPGCDYVVDPLKGPWVAKAYEWYVSGMSLLTVVRLLDEAGIRSTREKRITYKSLLSTLDGGFAAGLIVDRRGDDVEFLAGKQEPLITMDLWEKYNRKRKEHVPARTKSAPYRVSGLLRCAGCGGAMSSNWRGKGDERYRYFRCHKIQKTVHSANCPAPASVEEARVERLLKDWLEENSIGQAALDAATARAQAVGRAERDLGRIDKEISRLKNRMSMLYEDKLSGDISPEVYKMKEAEYLKDLKALEASRDASKVSAEVNALPPHTTFGALLAAWQDMAPGVFNQGLREVVSQIVVTKAPQPYGRSSVRIVGTWEPDLRVVRAG